MKILWGGNSTIAKSGQSLAETVLQGYGEHVALSILGCLYRAVSVTIPTNQAASERYIEQYGAIGK
jgi:hypothetical protein